MPCVEGTLYILVGRKVEAINKSINSINLYSIFGYYQDILLRIYLV